MDKQYEYYNGYLSGSSPSSPGASEHGPAYAYYEAYCVCVGEGIALVMRDLQGNETGSFPVEVYNVNEELINGATNKQHYIIVWNSDPANQAIGVLKNGYGTFGFKLTLNPGQTPPEYVIGVPNSVVDLGIYSIQYGIEYE